MNIVDLYMGHIYTEMLCSSGLIETRFRGAM